MVQAFQRGDGRVEVLLAVRGFPDGMPFYRPVVDDAPERRAEVLEQVLRAVQPIEAAPSVTVLASYPRFGTAHLRLGLEAALQLARHPLVHGLSTPRSYRQQADFAVEAAQFTALHSQGWRGGGRKIAVIDGEFQPAELPGLFVEEHCFCQRANGQPCCPNQQIEQHGPGASATTGLTIQPDHGNRVASLAGGLSSGGSAAPDAGVIAISTTVQDPDLLRALNYLATRADIDAVVMSFGWGSHQGICNFSPVLNGLLGALSALEQQGVMLVAAAGNAGGNTAMLSPACLSPMMAVTGTWSCANLGVKCPGGSGPDVLWSQSSLSAAATDIAAPAGPMILPTGLQNPSAGTSWSTPLVGGCAAVLRQAYPGASPSLLRAALQSSGLSATRPGAPVVPRLGCSQSMAWLAGNAPLPLNQRGITGNWYNPATGGQGLSLEVVVDHFSPGQGLLFGGWFTFDVAPAGGDAKQRWYVLQGSVTTGSSTAQLGIGTSVGGNFDASPSRPTDQVGTATFSLSHCNEGMLTYQFTDGSGRAGTIPLARLLSNVNCTQAGNSGGGHADYLLSGNWYNPATGGQGLVFEFNPVNPAVFATWFTFVPNGQGGGPETQRWYSLQLDPSGYTPGTRVFHGIPIGQTTGGVFAGGAPLPSIIQVGTASLQVISCGYLILTYSFTAGTNAGLSGSIPLQRLAGGIPPGCNF
ncbi:MAG: S8/S53 family peptidase [Xanthomonadales bacterium]|nr:S8/S53 family peptidase [Xanthomonadales bacterium]